MAILTIRAKEFDNNHKTIIKEYTQLTIDTQQFLIHGIGEQPITYIDINHIPVTASRGPSYVEFVLENNTTLRAYLQNIHNRRTMSKDLYQLLLQE